MSHIRITKQSPTYWRVTLDHPPLNIFGPDAVPHWEQVISAIEHDPALTVVVFDSAIDGFFTTHYDFLMDPAEASVAELYGYVNRALPDAELDGFVDAFAQRIASFDKRALAETKRFIDQASLPPDAEIAPEWDVSVAAIARPAAQRRIKKLTSLGLHQPGDVETRLGYHVGQVGR